MVCNRTPLECNYFLTAIDSVANNRHLIIGVRDTGPTSQLAQAWCAHMNVSTAPSEASTWQSEEVCDNGAIINLESRYSFSTVDVIALSTPCAPALDH